MSSLRELSSQLSNLIHNRLVFPDVVLDNLVPQVVDLLSRVRTRVGDEKWMKMSLDMHSCGLSAQSWRDLEVGRFYFLVFHSNSE